MDVLVRLQTEVRTLLGLQLFNLWCHNLGKELISIYPDPKTLHRLSLKVQDSLLVEEILWQPNIKESCWMLPYALSWIYNESQEQKPE